MMAYTESHIQTSAAASWDHWSMTLLLLLGLLSGCAGHQRASQIKQVQDSDVLVRSEYRHSAMGTLFRIVVYSDKGGNPAIAAKEAFDRVDEIEVVASDWNRESEIRTLCQSAPHEQMVPVSADLANLLQKSVKIHQQTQGRFDISMGALTRLWRRCFLAKRLPTDSDLEQARRQTGMQFIELDGGYAGLSEVAIDIDLGGIAKGYAVDEALKIMQASGYRHSLVDGGGDMAFGPPAADTTGWKILLPSGPRRVTTAGAVATSGDTQRNMEIDGEKYSHILNPLTGMGIRNSAMVTVFAEDAATADAYATAYSVPGHWPPDGIPGLGGSPVAIECLYSQPEKKQRWGVMPGQIDLRGTTGTGEGDSRSVP